ncbi:MAG: DUF2752 domain-containing protein [Planctomycetota bacterium]
MSASERWIFWSVLIGTASVIAASSWLYPDPRGYGTHQQLLLPPCDFLEETGYPCGSCGLTTSFSHMAHGEVFQAVVVQPFGALMFLGLLANAGWLLYCRATGRSYLTWLERRWKPIFIVGVVAGLAGWAYKVAASV